MKYLIILLLFGCASKKELKQQGFTDRCVLGIYSGATQAGIPKEAVNLDLVVDFCLDTGDQYYNN